MQQRHGMLVGFLAGGWLATVVLVLLPHLGLTTADAQPVDGPTQPFGPTGPTLPGPTINPVDGFNPRGAINPGFGTSDANRRAIALSASIGSGQSVVYYFDTETQRLCVYQYEPGNRGGLRLLAARLIEYDLKLEAYRDLSDKSPREMREAWEAAMRRTGGSAGGDGSLPTKRVDLPGGSR